MVNKFIQICLGFGLGQGVCFAAYTYLVINGEKEKLAENIVILSILSLVQWIADSGGLYFLKKKNIQGRILEFYIARIANSIIFNILIIMLLELLDIELPNLAYYQVFIISLIWSFNLTGLADESDKNRFIAPLNQLSWTASGLYLILSNSEDGYADITLMYTFGLVVTVFLQQIILKDLVKSRCRIEKKQLHIIVKTTLKYNLSFIFSQSYSRIINVLIESNLSINSAAVLLYAKSIVNIISQFVMFARRIEFVNLLTVNIEKLDLNLMLKKQRLTIGIVFTAMVVAVIALFFTKFVLEMEFIYQVNVLICVLLINQIIWCIPSIYTQFLIAKNNLTFYNFIIIKSMVISLLFLYIIGVQTSTVILSEIILYLAQIAIIIKRTRNDIRSASS